MAGDRSPREERRGLPQNLPLLFEHASPQLAQLGQLLAREPLALASVDLGLPDPLAQRLRCDPQLGLGLDDRPTAEAVETDRLIPELGRYGGRERGASTPLQG